MDPAAVATRTSYDALAANHADVVPPTTADLAALLQSAGFTLWTTAIREPEDTEKTAHGYLIARKRLAA